MEPEVSVEVQIPSYRGGDDRRQKRCFAKDVVGFQVVELEEDAQIFCVGVAVREPRTDFVCAEDELAEANFSRGHGLNLIGEDERAGIERAFFILRHAESGSDYADVTGFLVFDDTSRR